jgi:hypothetical protein
VVHWAKLLFTAKPTLNVATVNKGILNHKHLSRQPALDKSNIIFPVRQKRQTDYVKYIDVMQNPSRAMTQGTR